MDLYDEEELAIARENLYCELQAMQAPGEPDTAETEISYGEEVTFDDALKTFKEAHGEFEAVRTKHTKGLRKLKFRMPEEDRKRLFDAMYALLPLTGQKAVVESQSEELNSEKCYHLMMQIADMRISYGCVMRVGYVHSKAIWREPIDGYISVFSTNTDL